jgi:VanZ family protein
MSWIRASLWIGYWIALVVATHLPPDRMVPLPGRWTDKLIHLACFGGLGALTVWAKKIRTPGGVVVTLAALGVFAALDEWTQAWVGRQPGLDDWCADVVGITAGAVTTWILFKSRWDDNQDCGAESM